MFSHIWGVGVDLTKHEFYRCDVLSNLGAGVDLAKHEYYAKNIL